jgi:hypothetical protein
MRTFQLDTTQGILKVAAKNKAEALCYWRTIVRPTLFPSVRRAISKGNQDREILMSMFPTEVAEKLRRVKPPVLAKPLRARLLRIFEISPPTGVKVGPDSGTQAEALPAERSSATH